MLIELNSCFKYKLIYEIKKIFENISKEFSIIIWISMVLGLIIWSYMQNQHEISQRAEIKAYQQISIIDEIE